MVCIMLLSYPCPPDLDLVKSLFQLLADQHHGEEKRSGMFDSYMPDIGCEQPVIFQSQTKQQIAAK